MPAALVDLPAIRFSTPGPGDGGSGCLSGSAAKPRSHRVSHFGGMINADVMHEQQDLGAEVSLNLRF